MRLIYLSPVSWHSFSQRPHELVRCFHAKSAEPVLWLEPYPTRFPVFQDLLVRRQAVETRADIPSWLTVLKPRALPIEPFPCSDWLNRMFWQDVLARVQRFAMQPTLLGIGKPSLLALRLLREPSFKGSFYDAMDNVPAFYDGWSRYAMGQRQRQTARAATTVFTSSSTLQAHLSPLSNNISLLLNACASERFPPRSASRAAQHGPVFGYVGTIAKWFDWDLVILLAKTFPHAEVRLIGPLHVAIPPALPVNVRLLATLPHGDAIKAMAEFDVGLIPFKCNELTRFVDPIKYYEYRALGLPVVSTAFGEMLERRDAAGVFLHDAQTEIRALFEQALLFEESIEQTTQFRAENSWSARVGDAYAAL